MEKNIFEELYQKKQYLVSLTKKATAFGWITPERECEIIKKIDSDVLTIGVIGQMKCGKSTFLNSFVFEDDILPAATTPMTAALSVITYGEEKKIVADFYTREEWEEQKLQAKRSFDDVKGNNLEESKIKAAKELMEKSSKLGSNIDNLLGKKQEDSLDNLIEYVGADGRYISITKSVTIYYPKEYLKGVEIVDTPGFNDPIVSREERTKAFLKKADVVLMMLYAGRPFDATDRDIIFQNVRQCGIGKVIVGINKYDIPYQNGEGIDEIKNYVSEEIRKACKACDDNTLVEILKETEPIPLSAEMALLSLMPISKISTNKVYQDNWNRHCDIFEISDQKQMLEKSRLSHLTSAVSRIIEEEKGRILFAKPINSILAAGETKKEEINKVLRECEDMIQNLSIPDDELIEKLEKLQKAKRKLQKKIDLLSDDLNQVFRNIIRKGKQELEDHVDHTCKKMRGLVENNFKLFDKPDGFAPKLISEIQTLQTRTLRRSVEELSDDSRLKIKNCISDLIIDIDDILLRNLPDFNSKDFLKEISNQIKFEIEDNDMFSFDGSSSDEEDYGWGDVVWDFINGASWGVLGSAATVLAHSDAKRRFNEVINSISAEFDPSPYLNTIFDRKEEIISKVQNKIIDDLVQPMIQQIEEIRSKTGDKEKQLQEAKLELGKHKQAKVVVDQEIEEITQLKNSFE